MENSAFCASAADRGKTDDGHNRQATGKQFVAIVFILALATKMFLQPIFLIQAVGRDAYIALAIDGGLDIVSLVIIVIAMNLCKDADFFSLLTETIGKVAAKIVVCLFGLYMFFKLSISTSETIAFYSENVFSGFDVALMSVILLIFLTAIAKHTLRALSRLNEIIAPIVALCIVVLVTIVVATGVDFANIFPAMREPEFLPSFFRHATWLGDFTPLILFLGRTQIKKSTSIIAASAGVLGTAVAVFFSIVMCAAFGNVKSIVDVNTNLSSILQYSIGNVFGRIDLVSEILWSIASFIENALFFYSVCRCFEFVVGKNAHMITALAVSVALFFLLVFAMSDPTLFTKITVNAAASAISVIFTFAIPIVALVCAIVYRRKHKTARGDGTEEGKADDTARHGASQNQSGEVAQ